MPEAWRLERLWFQLHDSPSPGAGGKASCPAHRWTEASAEDDQNLHTGRTQEAVCQEGLLGQGLQN